MDTSTGGTAQGGHDVAIWLSPGGRLETLGSVLSRLAPGVRFAGDVAELAGADPYRARHLILDADSFPSEDVGYVRRFLVNTANSRATIVGTDAGSRVARGLLALPRTTWMSWPPDFDALLTLIGGPEALTPGANATESRGDAPSVAPTRGASSPASRAATTSRLGGSSAAAAAGPRTARTNTPSPEEAEIAQIQAILDGSVRGGDRSADRSADSSTAVPRADDDDRPPLGRSKRIASPFAPRAPVADTGDDDFHDPEDDFDEDDFDHDFDHEDEDDDFDGEEFFDADDIEEHGGIQDHATGRRPMRDGPPPDPRSSLAPDPRTPVPSAQSSSSQASSSHSASAQAAPGRVASSPTTRAPVGGPSSPDAGPFDAEFEVAFRDVPVTVGATSASSSATSSPFSGSPGTDGEPARATTSAQSAADSPTSPVAPRQAPPWWRAQVADLADAAQKLQLSMDALRTSGPNDEEVREHVDQLDAEVARVVQFARTLGYVAAPPSRGQQVFDLSDTVQLFVAQLASRPGGAPRCQFRALEPVYVRSDRTLIGTAFDAFFWLAGACSQGGDLVRAQVKREDGWAEVRVEFPSGPLAGFDTTTILEPYGVRRILPDLGANALAAASAIVFGQGGATTLTSFPSGRLGWRIVLPVVDSPRR